MSGAVQYFGKIIIKPKDAKRYTDDLILPGPGTMMLLKQVLVIKKKFKQLFTAFKSYLKVYVCFDLPA